MKPVTCPNCGNEIAIPWWLPRTVTCNECREELLVAYDEDPDADKRNIIARAKVKVNNFTTAHPKISAGITVAGIGLIIGGVLCALSQKESDTVTVPLAGSPDELPERQNDSLALASTAGQDDSISTQALSESEESAPVHREYSHRNPDNYDTVIHHLEARLVNLPEGQRPSQEKRDEYREKTGSDLPLNKTLRKEHDKSYQVKKN